MSLLVCTEAVFVEFFAPWCGHCKQLQPTWDSLASIFSAEAEGVVIAKVDATQDNAAALRFGVASYPALRLIRGNKVYEHVGSRQLPALEAFVRHEYKSAPATELPAAKPGTAQAATSAVVDLTHSSPSQFDRAVSDASSGIMLEFFAPWCGHCKSLAPEYDVAAAELHEEGVVFAKIDATQNKEQAERFGVTGYPTLVWVFGGQVFQYSGGRKAAVMIQFAKGGFEATVSTASDYSALEVLGDDSDESSSPTEGAVVTLTDASFEHLTQASTGATTGPWFVKFFAPWCGHCKKMAPQWEKLAIALKGRVNVAEVDCTAHRSTCKRFAVEGYPALKYIDAGQVWSYTSGRTAKRMQQWVEKGRLAADADAPVPVPAAGSLFGAVEAEALKAGEGLVDILRNHTVPSVILAAVSFVAGLFTMMVVVLLTETPREVQPGAAAAVPLPQPEQPSAAPENGENDEAETKKDK